MLPYEYRAGIHDQTRKAVERLPAKQVVEAIVQSNHFRSGVRSAVRTRVTESSSCQCVNELQLRNQ